MFPYKTTFQPVGDTPNLSQPRENQWSNPSNYQVDLDTVDWAALAQQWITMKEACSTSTPVVLEPQFVTMPIAPPPPTISKPNQHDLGEEQGEAPMEVEHDEDDQSTQPIANHNLYVAPPAPVNLFRGSNNQSNNGTANASIQSNWNNAKPSETKPWQKKGSRRNNSHAGRNTNDSKNYRQPHTFRGDPYNTISPQIYNLKSNESSWQMASPVAALAPAQSQPSHAHAHAHTHADAAHTPHTDHTQFKSGTQLDNVDLMPSTLDAAQRKTLPAWIREGLEKMERSKQREVDRIREAKERDEKQRQIRLAGSKVISLHPGGVAANIEPTAVQLPLKSKFESDSDDDSDSEVDDIDHQHGGGDDGDANSETKKSVADAYAIAKAGSSKASPIVRKPHRSKADILQDIMLSVRKNLTEILLEVTNEQINAIANETLSKMRSKGLKAQTVQKNALTAITGGLGLVTYDDSDGSKSSSEDEDDEPDVSNKSRNDDDSDDELMNTIEQRKMAFEIKSAEIEEYLAQNDEKEKNWLEKDDESSEKSTESMANSGNGTPSASSAKLQNRSESGEIQQDKNKFTTSSGRRIDRKSSRFSDAKGLVYNVAHTVTTMGSTNFGSQSIHSVDVNRADVSKDSENSSDSMKKSSYVSMSKSQHSNKLERSDRNRRSSSSSRSRYSRREHSHRDRSSSRHRHRSRSHSPSTDRASKSSRSTRDTYSKEKSYNRSHSHRSSSKRGHSRSRSRSYDSRSSYHRHR